MNVPDGPATRSARLRETAASLVIAVVMLLVLQGVVATAGALPLPARVAGLVGLVGTTLIFATVLVRTRQPSAPVPPRAVAVVLGTQAGCAALVSAVVGEQGLVTVTFWCVTAIFLLPRGAAGWIVALNVAAVVGLPRAVPGWQPVDETAVSGALLGLAAFGMVQGAHRRRRLEREQRYSEQLATYRERERITQEMHDVLGHSLTVISVKTELAARLLHANAAAGPAVPAGGPAGVVPSGVEPAAAGTSGGGPAARVAGELADVQSLARTALADVRSLIADERRPTLPGELAAARSAFDAAGIDADLPAGTTPIPADRDELFARVLREACTNILRHSGARRVTVTLTPGTLTVDNDAPPRRPAADTSASGKVPAGGNGLTGLDARARAAGATLDAGPRPGGGFRVAVTYAITPDGRATA